MSQLRFNVLDSVCIMDDQSFSANDNPHTVEEPSDELVKHAGSAHHAGAIDVIEGLVDGHIQSQEDGEAALAAAQGEWVEPTRNEDGSLSGGHWTGPWGEVSREQSAADQKGLAEAGMVVEVDEGSETE